MNAIARLRAERCRGCDVAQGEPHVRGCPEEYCARCGRQAVLCDHRPRRRLPFIAWANVCAGCGVLHPEFFDVPKRVWCHYIEPAKRGDIVCEPCFREIAALIDGGAFMRRHGGPVPMWSREFRRRHRIPPGERSPWDDTTEAETRE